MRYTEKVDKKQEPNSANDYIILGAFTDMSKYCKAVDKFGQLEDIEEELGIDLVTLFKALKSGVYFKNIFNDKHSGFIELIEFSDFVDVCYDQDTNEWFIDIKGQSHNTTKNYGKTWALTKEELEK